MVALHDGLRGPARITTLAALRQWAVDHEQSDRDQFASIDRKLNWLIGGIVAVLVTVTGAMAHELWTQRGYVPAPPPAAAAPLHP